MKKKSTIYLLLLLLTCIVSLGANGQKVPVQKLTIRLADKSFNEFAYMEAIEMYGYAIEKDSSNMYLVRQLAEANRFVGNTEQVEYWLKKIIDKHHEQPEDLFNYAQALKSNGKYVLAQYWLKQYSELRPQDGRVALELSLVQYMQLLKRDSVNYEIRNVSINTPGSEIGPAFYKDQLVFSSTSLGHNSKTNFKWNDLPYLDMYSATIDNNTGELSSPVPFALKLKTAYHDGPVSFDRINNRIIYFTRNNFVKGKASASKEGIVNLKIFMGRLDRGEWKMICGFSHNSDEYSVGHPSIDQNGSILYFTSDMPGGYGKSDLYVSVRSNGSWSKPLNLGPKINTEGNELFPFISNDGVLYFASDGHGGLGGLDVCYSVPEQGIFSTAQNMGYPINSSKDDFGIALDSTGMKGYFSSNRSGGKGNDDLYFLKIKRIPFIIRGTIKDLGNKDELADATIKVVDEKGKTISTSITGSDGQFEFEVDKGQCYGLKVTKEFYLDNETQVATNALGRKDEVNSEIFLEQKIEEIVDNSSSPIPIEMRQ